MHLLLESTLLNLPALTQGSKTAWFTYQAPEKSNDVFSFPSDFVKEAHDELEVDEHSIRSTLTTLRYEESHSRVLFNSLESLREILRFVAPHQFRVPDIHLIPAIRKIGEAGSEYTDYSGVGIIRRLHQLQNPGYDKQHLKAKFQDINGFLQSIIGDGRATLEITHDASMVMVHMGGKTLPLSSLGTGIHEVVILAAAATVVEKQILCIEEPELHLHPLLQRKLIRYLKDKTHNQYFLTTHSAHFLDEPGVQVFHVRYQDGKSTVDPVSTAVQRSAICTDLGYRAFDLVQANSVVWVEGPSDRIYLKHWISAVDPQLIEGLHYSIMFYGGRLLSHLSANDPEIEDFVSLRRLNRYISVLIDSDKEMPRTKINETKRRLQGEFDQGPGFAWITRGREIENYIDPALLEQCVKAVHPSAVRLDKTGQFDHLLLFRTKKGTIGSNVDKVKVAHEVVKHQADLSVLDLKKMVTQLVKFVRSANDF